MIDFTGYRTDNSTVKLNWVTNADVASTRMFYIERSTDGTNFYNIGSRQPVANTSNYTYDDSPVSGTVYYRLRIEDINGRISYSTILRIAGNDRSDKASVFPNPVTSSLQLHVPDAMINTKAILTSSSGSVVKTIQITARNITVDISELPGAVYYLKLQDGQVVRVMKSSK